MACQIEAKYGTATCGDRVVDTHSLIGVSSSYGFEKTRRRCPEHIRYLQTECEAYES